jgi:hypothetical protein
MRGFPYALILMFAATASAFAQTELTIDLKDAGNVSVQVPPGQYTIKIINMVPGKQYDVTTEVKPIIEAPVSIAEAKKVTPPATKPEDATKPQAGVGENIDCSNALDNAGQSDDAADLVAQIKKARDLKCPNLNFTPACARLLELETKRFTDASTAEERKAAIIGIRADGNASGCANVTKYAEDRCADLLKTAKTEIAKISTEAALAVLTVPLRVLAEACEGISSYLASIEQKLGPFALGQNEMLTVSVVRKDNSTTWVRNFSTGKRGEWLAGYGILLVPNRDANYSSYSLGNDVYSIRRSRDREKFDYVPTLTFTFMRPKDAPRNWFASPVFGIGYDLQTVSGTVGYALTYNHNFAISAGVMLHQQRRLKGKYEEDEHYTKTGNVLENDDLTEKTWAPNVYVGITIRSLTNPFAR